MSDQEKPLEGKTVLVTRGEKQAGELSRMLRKYGAETVEIAVIEIGEPESWEPLDTALGAIAEYDWVIFASTNAVQSVVARSTAFGADYLKTADLKVAAIGSATQEKLLLAGIKTDFQPSKFVAEEFVEEFCSANHVHGKRILLPRTNAGRTVIADGLTERGATVDMVEAYSTNLPKQKDEVSRQLSSLFSEKKVDVVTFASSQTAKNFADLLIMNAKGSAPASLQKVLKGVVIAAIGPVTADTCRELLGEVHVEADEHTVQGLVSSLIEHCSSD
jgi:uroporphyrinogen-III synthase